MSIYNTPLEERFGEKLEELREGKNMTREQLADQVGLTARHIAALERGERRPTLNTMEKLLRALGAPTEWLIYPEFEEQNARLHEISHLAATFSDEQQEFLLGMMRLMRKQKYGGRHSGTPVGCRYFSRCRYSSTARKTSCIRVLSDAVTMRSAVCSLESISAKSASVEQWSATAILAQSTALGLAFPNSIFDMYFWLQFVRRASSSCDIFLAFRS